MAGLAAAISAARHGAGVVLMRDRAVPGGNASSQCRVHICGADRHNRISNLRETGILEGLRLANPAANPQRSFSEGGREFVSLPRGASHGRDARGGHGRDAHATFERDPTWAH